MNLRKGARCHHRDRGVHGTHLLYADDLTLSANDPHALHILLIRLDLHARRKYSINMEKSGVVHYNSLGSDSPIFWSRECHWSIRSRLSTWACGDEHGTGPLSTFLESVFRVQLFLCSSIHRAGRVYHSRWGKHTWSQLACMQARCGAAKRSFTSSLFFTRLPH